MLKVTGRVHQLTRQWADALEHVVVRHPNRAIVPILTLDDSTMPNLFFALESNPSSEEDEIISPFTITNVKLSFFPGTEVARMWLAAGWACFLQHEALELVTFGSFKNRCLDPHLNRGRLDHVFHAGLPFTLTPETLLGALATAIPREEAEALIAAAAVVPAKLDTSTDARAGATAV